MILSGIFLFTSCSVSSPESEIRKFVSTRLAAIREGDLDAYMETVSSSDSYYVNEQCRWFYKMVTFPFMDLNIGLAAIMEIGSDAESGIYLAAFRQAHTYDLLLEIDNNTLIDNRVTDKEYAFEQTQTEHFKNKYSILLKAIS